MERPALQDALEELSSAEEFLEYFAVAFDPAVVHVNRLHILQRFHDYIEAEAGALAQDDAARSDTLRALLQRAYDDFVGSDARREKVFRVFRRHEPQTVFVPLREIRR